MRALQMAERAGRETLDLARPPPGSIKVADSHNFGPAPGAKVSPMQQQGDL